MVLSLGAAIAARAGYLLERLARAFQSGDPAGEGLPTLDRNLAIDWIEINRERAPPLHLASHNGGARAHKRVEHELAAGGVVHHRAPHAFHRLLRAVASVVFDVLNEPDRRLLAPTNPTMRGSVLHDIVGDVVLLGKLEI